MKFIRVICLLIYFSCIFTSILSCRFSCKDTEASGKIEDPPPTAGENSGPPDALKTTDFSHNSATRTSLSFRWKNPPQTDFLYILIGWEPQGEGHGTLVNPFRRLGRPGQESSLTITGLMPNTSYTVTFKSVDIGGHESDPLTLTASTLSDDPTDPPDGASITGFTATTQSCVQVNLQWNNPTDANVKEVRLTRTDGTNTSISSVIPRADFTEGATTSKSIRGLKDDTDYTFSIFSRTRDDEDSETITQSARTSPCDELQAPSSINSTPTNRRIRLTWIRPTQLDF